MARLGGGVLSGATAGLAALRSRAKPLHPRGEVWQGRLVRSGNPASATGVVWLDEPGEDAVLVRLSAAIGLPSLTWDIAGLAIRLSDEGDADVLLATTGAGPLTRFVLLPTLAAHQSGLTTLLPYRTPVGPLFLRAVPEGGSGSETSTRYTLAYARGLRGWVDFAHLELVQRSEAHVSFDPVLSSPPGLGIYPWVALLRAPAYARARRSRGDSARHEGAGP
ncbi:hypothetical protein E2C04_10715 [Nocardioides daphniae]|uniref:Phosphodiesterase n=1 Tax=Nocardioides daphniae TaxID=402297 RepID=A0A4P7UFW4_9ACTN|nr:hypothetical protein E2C04_10715 [Nocardioides daphniae]